MTELLALWPPLLMGLLGAGHCFAMCGGIASALSFGSASQTRKPVALIAAYNVGRIIGYLLVATVFALIVQQVPSSGFPLARIVVGSILILTGLSFVNVTQGIRPLEKVGAVFWRLIKPLGDRFLPIDSIGKGLWVGMIWGWLPCGLVYSALAYAVAQNSIHQTALAMLAFGLGTFPAVFFSGLFAQQARKLLTFKGVRWASGLAFIGFGLWTIITVTVYSSHHHHESSSHSEHTQHSHETH